MTKNFPEEEKFGIISQMRRAAYSVPMNLVEGANRLNSKEYRHFVGIAKGSAGEITYQLLLARDLKYMEPHRQACGTACYAHTDDILSKEHLPTAKAVVLCAEGSMRKPTIHFGQATIE